MRMLTGPLLAFLVAGAAMSAGCEPVKLAPSTGDLIPEVALSGATLNREWTVANGFVRSPLLAAPNGATRTGFMLDVTPAFATADVSLEARGERQDGSLTPWAPALVTFSEGLLRVGYVDHHDAVFGIQLRMPAGDRTAVDALVYSAVVPMPEQKHAPSLSFREAGAVDLVSGPAVAAQALDIVGVQPRSAWGAAATRCTSLNTTKTRISVHHTVTPTSSNGSYAARIRGIQAYHQDSRNWCDIGYHFMVTLDGETWEAREAKFLGTHVGGQNTNNLGVSYVGCFQTDGCNDWGPAVPPQVMIDNGGALIGKLATRYGISVSPSTVMGHRDNPGANTSCPGANLYARLDDLRDIASEGGGDVEPPLGIVQGVIWDLSITSEAGQSMELGARLPGATITASDGTTATARAEDAFWSIELAPGTYTITAVVDGFAPGSREIQVTAGATEWSSMGIAPLETAVSLQVTVQDAVTAAPIALATVQATGADPGQTDATGMISFSLAAGSVTVAVSAEGYEAASETWTFSDGATEERTLALTPVVLNEPETPSPEGGPESQPEAPNPEAGEPETPSPETGGPEVVFEPDATPNEPEPVTAPLTGDGPSVAGCSSTETPSHGVPLFAFSLLAMAVALLRRR